MKGAACDERCSFSAAPGLTSLLHLAGLYTLSCFVHRLRIVILVLFRSLFPLEPVCLLYRSGRGLVGQVNATEVN